MVECILSFSNRRSNFSKSPYDSGPSILKFCFTLLTLTGFQIDDC